jgi:hypothetical protein
VRASPPGARLLVFFGFAASSLWACEARAQDDRRDFSFGHHAYESPQNFAVELRLGPYYPDIDSDPTLTQAGPSTNPNSCQEGGGPAQAAFGTSNRVMAGLEFDWQALRIPHLGTLGPGVAIGYTNLSGNALFVNKHVPPSGGEGTCQSGESTSLAIVPIYALAVLRADVLWREFRIPLVPYVKAGLGDALWRASNTLGTSTANGVVGEGHTYGAQFAVGLSLNLNIFDEYAAKNIDQQVGVNNTYLFAEYMWANFQGLGLQTDPLRVGDSTWVVGLTWEF